MSDIKYSAEERAFYSAQRLFANLADTFPAYAAEFDARWQVWQQAISPSSDPFNWSSVPEFDALVALGPKVIPLVLWKLVRDDEDATAVYLYNTLEKDPAWLVNDSLDQKTQVPGIMEKNFQRNRLVRNALLDWAEYCEMVCQSRADFYTEYAEYRELVKLGASVVPQLMLKYKKREGVTFAYELLHEIVWGHRADEQTVFMEYRYRIWSEWFEKKDWEQAPRYREGKRVH